MSKRGKNLPNRVLKDELLVEVKVIASLDISNYKAVYDPQVRSKIREAFIKDLDLLLCEGLSEDVSLVGYSSKVLNFKTKSARKPGTRINVEDQD